jgi:ABC-2 type transport system permease protein
MRGLLQLTWLEIKIFLREPLGAVGIVVVPVFIYVFLGQMFSRGRPVANQAAFLGYVIPTFAALFIAINAVLSLVTIIAIYRESGILKRLRATPLRPRTILVAHVLVKLLFTVATLLLMTLAGRRYFPSGSHIPVVSFGAALLLSTWSILALGFVFASVVKVARFAQTAAGFVFYPMVALSGLFYPIDKLPPFARALSKVTPLTYAVSLMRGILEGDGWRAHLTDVGALLLVFVVSMALTAKLFRWE